MKTRKILFYLITWTIVVLLRLPSAMGANETQTVIKTGEAIKQGITISDRKYPAMDLFAWKPKSTKTVITLGVDLFSIPANAGVQNITLDIRITYYDRDNYTYVKPSATTTIPLSISYDPSGTTSPSLLKDKDMLSLDDAYRVDVQIVNPPSVNGVVGGTIGQHIYLKAEMNVERYYVMYTNVVPYTSDKSQLNRTYISATNELEVYWAEIDGAETYDLEYAYVDDYGSDLNTPLSLASLKVDFSTSTRVTIAANSYRIPLLYDRGYVVFRVRGVSKTYATIDNKNLFVDTKGEWSSDDLALVDFAYPLTSFAPTHLFYVTSELTDAQRLLFNMNAQTTSSFAEEGKRSDVSTFFDGSLRSRQMVTRDNSTQHLIVSETFYDFQGRAAIQTLPVPYSLANDPNGNDFLWYRPNFNRNNANQPYSKADFDLNPWCDPVQPAPMATTNGAANYYSSDNPSLTGPSAFLPDANGFPFTQTEYTPDNTGRIRTQGGVGPYFQVNDRPTRYLYVQPEQEELDRILGSEAGYANHYKKNITIDPNKQASISYLNLEGKVVATSLTGTAPLSLQPLSSYAEHTLTAKQIESCDVPGCTKALNDQNTVVEDALLFSKQFAVASPGTYTFQYDITPGYFDVLAEGFTCENPSPLNTLCYECVYDLVLEVRDECGNLASVSDNDKAQVVETLGSPDGTFQCTLQEKVAKSFSMTLQPGVYTLIKKLAVNKQALDNYVTNYFSTNQCETITNEELAAESESVAPQASSPCDEVDCKTCKSSLYFTGSFDNNTDYTNGMNAYNTAHPDFPFPSLDDYKEQVDNCRSLCEPANACQAALGMMLGDMSPEGQYGASSSDEPNWALSVFNKDNQLPLRLSDGANKGSYLHPSPAYADDKGPSYILLTLKESADLSEEGNTSIPQDPGVYIPEVTNASLVKKKKRDANDQWIDVLDSDPEAVYVTVPENLKNLDDFLDQWQPGWENSLIIYHPEYCYYDFCAQNANLVGTYIYSSVDFDNRLQEIETFADAISAQDVTFGANVPNPLYDPKFTEALVDKNKNIGDADLLLASDPFFQGGQGTNSLGVMKNEQGTGRLQNYQNTSLSLADFVATTIVCGTLYHADKTLGLTGCDASGFNAWNDEDKDNFWRMYSALYLSEKQKLQQELADQHCSGDGTCTTSSSTPYLGQNACIGDAHYNAYNSKKSRKHIRNYPCQPCSYPTYKLYAGMTKRFGSNDDLQAAFEVCATDSPEEQSVAMQKKVNMQIYLQTGQCPMTRDLSYFLDDLAKNGMVSSHATDVDLVKYKTFTQRMYDYVSFGSQDPINGYIHHFLSSTFVQSQDGTLNSTTFQISGPTDHPVTCGNIALVFQNHLDAAGNIPFNFDANSSGFTAIVGLSSLVSTGTGSDNPFSATLYVNYTDPTTQTITQYEVPVTGTTCLPLRQCEAEFANVCLPSQETEDLTALLSAIASNGDLGNQNYLALTSTGDGYDAQKGYASLFTPILKKYVSGNQSGNWYFRSSQDASDRTLEISTDKTTWNMKITFHQTTQEAIDYTKLTSFSCIKVANASPHFSLTGWYTSDEGATFTNPLFDITVDLQGAAISSFKAAECGPPVQDDCNTTAHKNVPALDGLMKDLTAFLSVGATQDLTSNVHFIDQLQSQITGSGVYSWKASKVSTDQDTLYADILNNGASVCPFKLYFRNNLSVPVHFSDIIELSALQPDFSSSSLRSNHFEMTATYWQDKDNNHHKNQGEVGALELEGTSCFIVDMCNAPCIHGISNLVKNGGFEDDYYRFENGITYGHGFQSNYHIDRSGVPVDQGQIRLGDDVHPVVFPNNWEGKGHGGTGNFLLIDQIDDVYPDRTEPRKVWFTTLDVLPNSTYAFSAFGLNLDEEYDNSSETNSYDTLNFYVIYLNDPLLQRNYLFDSKNQAPRIYRGSSPLANPNTDKDGWLQLYTNVTIPSGVNRIEIGIVAVENNGQDDVGLDDISFTAPCNIAQPVFPEVIVDNSTDPCQDYIKQVAQGNAEIKNNRSVEQKTQELRAKYTAKCLNAAENLAYSYPSIEHHFTLYFYDQAGNLVKTIPPEGVKNVLDQAQDQDKFAQIKLDRKNGAYTASAQPVYTMATTYQYNSLNQLVSQNTPDARTTQFWYDEVGRIIVSQNAKQAATSSQALMFFGNYMLYDDFNRVKETGQIQTPFHISTLVGANGQIRYADYVPWLSAIQYVDMGNGPQPFKTPATTNVTKTYYDLSAFELNQITIPNFGQENLRKRISYTTYNENGDEAYDHGTFYSYDMHGNVKTVIQDFNLASASVLDQANRFKRIDYDYDLISGKVNQVHYQPGQRDQFHHRYDYDAQNKLTEVYTSRDSLTWENDAHYEYYPHGPLARVEYGDAKIQGMDYAYTLQGWVKGTNSSTLIAYMDQGKDAQTDGINKNIPKDVASYSLDYFTNDYYPVGNGHSRFDAYDDGSAFAAARHNLYNGNISAMVTTITKASSQMGNDTDPLGTALPLGTVYRYDQLNRIVGMNAFDNMDIYQSYWPGGTPTNPDQFASTFQYDANGNLQHLTRNNAIASPIESLDYQYVIDTDAGTPTNTLQSVSGSLTTTYGYDRIGNLLSDPTAKIGNIVWNPAGKMTSITKTVSERNDEEYQYDAMGNKIAKIIKPHIQNSLDLQDPNSWTYQYYVRDVSGEVMAIYQMTPNGGDATTLQLTELPIYGSARIGQLSPQLPVYSKSISTGTPIGDALPDPDRLSRILGNKQYELGNHLGNVLTVVSDHRFKSNGTYSADIVSVSDYYPFGSKITERSTTGMSAEDNQSGYRYGFNGKEQDFSAWNEDGRTYDYGFRIYDARIGRFLSVDPLTKSYPWNSTYGYAEGNPVKYIDLDGLEKFDRALLDQARTKLTQAANMTIFEFPKNSLALGLSGSSSFGPAKGSMGTDFQFTRKGVAGNFKASYGVQTKNFMKDDGSGWKVPRPSLSIGFKLSNSVPTGNTTKTGTEVTYTDVYGFKVAGFYTKNTYDITYNSITREYGFKIGPDETKSEESMEVNTYFKGTEYTSWDAFKRSEWRIIGNEEYRFFEKMQKYYNQKKSEAKQIVEKIEEVMPKEGGTDGAY